MSAEVLARIDAARAAVAEARNHVEHFPITEGDAVRVTRLADMIESLIPEIERPTTPSTGDEREALIDAMIDVPVSSDMVEFAPDDREDAGYLADAIIASPVWRNRHRGPITDEMVDAALSVLEEREHGMTSVQDDMRAALEAAEVVNNHDTEYLRIELADGVYDVLASSERFWVTDTTGTVLGIPDPVLPTTPPDLE